MLNSAAGVMFPSAMAPPIRTIRSIPPVPCASRYRATFVNGPVGTSVTGRAAAATAPAIHSTASRETGSTFGGGQRRPVEPALAVDVCRDDELALQRLRRSGGDGHVRAARELQDAQRVRRGLLERLVAVGRRHAEQVELGACQREQQRDRVVVPGVAVEDDRRGRHGVGRYDSCAAPGAVRYAASANVTSPTQATSTPPE